MTDNIRHIFRAQTPSRRKPQAGDVFSIALDKGFLLGRVVSTSARSSQFSDPNALMVYVYSTVVDDPNSDAKRDPGVDLLIPPVLTNTQGWLKGYFGHVRTEALQPHDVLAEHVFRSPSTGELFSEGAARLDGVSTPERLIGVKALDSYLTIEDSVSRALGMGPTITYDERPGL